MAIYGVANPWPTPAVYAPASDATLVAGTETLAITTTSALKGNPGQSYQLVIMGCAVFTMGSSHSVAATIGARFAGGSDFATQVIPAALLVNSATFVVPVMMFGASVDAAADGTIGGAAIEITGLVTTQNATWVKIGTAIGIMLIPGGAS